MEFEAVRDLISNHIKAEKIEDESEEAFIRLIAERVAELMESNMELFINHLYRMDIDEKKVNRTLLLAEESEESVYISFARLIFERQKERLESRKRFKQKPMDFWGDE